MRKPFRFKQFEIYHDQCAMKVGTDGVLLGAWANHNEANKILDIGTGTGLIAIMLGQRCKTAQLIEGVEIDSDAYHQALENVENSPWKEKIKIHHSKIQEFAPNHKYDLIVSNPPFFLAGTQAKTQQRHQARHTQTLSFDDLLKSVKKLLAEEGKFSVVLPYQEGLSFIEKAKTHQLFCTRKTAVRSKHDKPLERLLLQFENKFINLEENELVIQYEQRNDYTEDYIALTQDFYIIM
ncbi:MAG: methyltransferase [Cytophagales bacterium]|nr:methyltransferase [Cytophagales bacterium]